MNELAQWDDAGVEGDMARAARPGMAEQLSDAVLGRVLSRASARLVYGEPVTQGERTIVPVANVATRFGFGGGSSASNAGDAPSSGGGMGGGGDLRAKPLGYIEVTPEGSRFVTIEDETEIAQTALRVCGVVAGIVALRFVARRGANRSACARHEADPALSGRGRWLASLPWGALTGAASEARSRIRIRRAA